MSRNVFFFFSFFPKENRPRRFLRRGVSGVSSGFSSARSSAVITPSSSCRMLFFAHRFFFLLFLFRVQRHTAGSGLWLRRCLVCGLFFTGRHIVQSRLCDILRLGRIGAAVAHVCEDFFQRKILAVSRSSDIAAFLLLSRRGVSAPGYPRAGVPPHRPAHRTPQRRSVRLFCPSSAKI